MKKFTDHIRLVDWLGVGGVSPDESDTAVYFDRILRWPLLVIAFWLPLQWHLADRDLISEVLSNKISWFVWLAFVFETVSLTFLVKDKKRYLFCNWTNLLIIASALPAFWMSTPISGMLRLLRLIIIPRLIITWWISH